MASDQSLNDIGPGINIKARDGRWSVRFRLPADIAQQYDLPRMPRLTTDNLRGDLSTRDDIGRLFGGKPTGSVQSSTFSLPTMTRPPQERLLLTGWGLSRRRGSVTTPNAVSRAARNGSISRSYTSTSSGTRRSRARSTRWMPSAVLSASVISTSAKTAFRPTSKPRSGMNTSMASCATDQLPAGPRPLA